MILDMNINLNGIDEEFLDELDELIEETRVEYFVINPLTKDELVKTQDICTTSQRFKYVCPVKLIDDIDDNCIALRVQDEKEIDVSQEFPIIVDSSELNDSFIETLNKSNVKGVVLNAIQKDIVLENFVYSISQNSLKKWEQLAIKNIDFNKIALQSDYPEQSYDDFLDVMLKEISDMTFRAEQTIAAGGTRTLLKLFKLL